MDVKKVDIVVIGGGGAGFAAALAAAEKDADVVIIEKRSVAGGNSSMAGGLFAAESPVQKRQLIDARRDVLFRIAMDYAHWNIDPMIVRAFVDKSGDTIRWLEEKGVEFTALPAMYPNQAIRTNHVTHKGGAGIINKLKARCEGLGTGIFYKTSAKELLLDKEGNVEGVIAEKEDSRIFFKAKCIIIATGGYGGNKELLKQYHMGYHKNIFTVGLPHTGDGLIMAMEIGAATEGLGILQLSGPEYPGAMAVRLMAQEPNTLWVNKRGERFTDEANTFDLSLRGNAVNRQPEKITYTLVDETIKNIIQEEGLVQLPHVPHGSDAIQPGDRLPDLSDQLNSEAEKGKVKISETLDDIAGWMGADVRVLKDTIESYNSFCDQGHDRIFVKDPKYLLPLRTPPYYAIKCFSCFTDTMGGIKVNQRMEVLDQRDDPIKGLYGAGVCVGGWESDTYCYILSGSTLGFAFNSGRIAGENAVTYLENA